MSLIDDIRSGRGLKPFGPGEPEHIQPVPPAPIKSGRVEVLYLCDGEKCAKPCGDCRHTTDIRHARNFEARESTIYADNEPWMTVEQFVETEYMDG